jgi:hypothetical protein
MEQAIAAANDGTVTFQQCTFSSSDLEQKTSSDGWYRQKDAMYDVALIIQSLK